MITQQNLENITFGRMAKLLKYVGTGTVNDLVQAEILGLLEDFESQQTEISLYARLVGRLEAIGWQPSQVKKVIDMLAEARQKERKELRERVAVSFGDPFLTGRLHVSRVIFPGVCRLLQCWIYTDGTNPASINLFNSPDITDTQDSAFLMRVSSRGGDFINSDSFKEEIFCTSLTCILEGERASYNICYRVLEPGKNKGGLK